MESVRHFLRFVFWVLVILLVLAFFMRDRLPSKERIQPELGRDPIQEKMTLEPFQVAINEIEYTVSPQYTYDIVGLVVSEHRSDALFDYYHKLWQDSLNVNDVCVVWGENALSGIYKNMTFRSGSWTCYVNTKDQKLWRYFSPDKLSNNHLLTPSSEIQKVLNTVRRGDQIRIKGYLVNYSTRWGSRNTSVTRFDNGCENIYISEIELLHQPNFFWKSLFTFSSNLLLFVVILRILLHFFHIHGSVKKEHIVV